MKRWAFCILKIDVNLVKMFAQMNTTLLNASLSMKKCIRLSVFAFLVMPVLGFSQSTSTPVPEVLYYSRITQSFDRQPPIGSDFQIKGSITPDIVAVKLESFGFDMVRGDRAHQVQLINVLTNADHSRPLCEVLDEVRNDDTRPRSQSSWERPVGDAGLALSQFSMNHEQLYYGRRYVFLLSYYTRITEAKKKEVAEKFVRHMYDLLLEKAKIKEVMTPDEWDTEIKQLMPELRSSQAQVICGEELLNRRTLKPVDLAAEFLPVVSREIQVMQDKLVLDQGKKNVNAFNSDFDKVAKAYESKFSDLKNFLSLDDWENASRILKDLDSRLATTSPQYTAIGPLNSLTAPVLSKKESIRTTAADQTNIKTTQIPTIDAALVALRAKFDVLKARIAAKDWIPARAASLELRALFQPSTTEHKMFSDLILAVGDIIYGEGAISPGETLEDVVSSVLARLPFSDNDEIITATSSQPYFESMAKEQQFLISLDGGLTYVSKFRELIPVLGINIKLNRIDFDDPWNQRTEWSLIMGLGMTKPDDLDPDYKGIFDRTGDRSFMLGLGLRSPRISRLVRLQLGGAFYRQADRNPVVKDFRTSVSPYVGLSLNWNTLDFAAGLLRNPSNFNLRY